MKKLLLVALLLGSVASFAQQRKARRDMAEVFDIPKDLARQDLKGAVLSNIQFSDSLYTGKYYVEPVLENDNVVAVKLKLAAEDQLSGLQEIIDALDFKTRPAPDFEVTDLTGKRYKLADLKDKTVVLNFWFTSCMPCVEEIPLLNELVAKNKDVVFIAMANDKLERIKSFLPKHPFSYRIIPDADKVVNDYRVSAFPTHYVIKKGMLTHKFIESTNIAKNLQQAIDEQ